MSDARPLTKEEEREVRDFLACHDELCAEDAYGLLATLDAERARAERAEHDIDDVRMQRDEYLRRATDERARAEKAEAALATVHEALGESPASDDGSLGEVVGMVVRDLRQRCSELEAALDTEREAHAATRKERDAWRAYQDSAHLALAKRYPLLQAAHALRVENEAKCKSI